MDIEGKIKEYLGKKPGSKAKDIAYSIGIPKKTVNSHLYGDLAGEVQQDEVYQWYLIEDSEVEVLVNQAQPKQEYDMDEEDLENEGPTLEEAVAGHPMQDLEDRPTRVLAGNTLEAIRKKLLDLTGNNPLLNYKHPRASCVRLIDELPNQIFHVLNSGKSFDFIPIPEPSEEELIEAGYLARNEETNSIEVVKEYPSAEEWGKYLGFATSYDLPDEDITEEELEKHNDTSLQTLFYSAQLDSRMRSIRSKAETAIEESGSNILYLAIGFLQWYESTESDIRRLAPLFTIPVKLEREKIRSEFRYKILLKDDGLITNITLAEKLSTDFGLVLPEIGEEANSPEDYFKRVEYTIINSQPRWKIKRHATLALLNFSKQVMYQDLDPDNWPEEQNILDHPLIRQFFEESSDENSGSGIGYTEEYEIDEIVNIHKNYPLIYEADSSQYSALIDAADGENLVIEGPPGTGKSQTITNIIAACIANNQKVLFVAEKMAALDVVKKRLDKASLGDFCLELHSHKTNKVKILKDLTHRLNNQGNYKYPNNLEVELQRYDDLKEKLIKYVKRINSDWKNTGLTIHTILNRATRYRNRVNVNSNRYVIETISGDNLTPVKLQELLDDIDILANVYDQISRQANEANISEHYWYGIVNSELMGGVYQDVLDRLKTYQESLSGLISELTKFGDCFNLEDSVSLNRSDIEETLKGISALPELKGNELLENFEVIYYEKEAFKKLLSYYRDVHLSYSEAGKILATDVIGVPSSLKSIWLSCQNLTKLGLNMNVTISDVLMTLERLKKLISSVEEINTEFDLVRGSIGKDLEVCFELKRNGLDEFVKLIDLLGSLEPSLWTYKSDLLDNFDADNYLVTLEEKISKLSPLEGKLIDIFSLHRLPDCSELKQIKSELDNDGFFRFFSSEFRRCSKDLKSLSVSKNINKKVLKENLSDLIDYVEQKGELERFHQSNPIIGGMYKGVETPTKELIQVRDWYRSIREEYGLGFGNRVPIGNAIVSIDRNLSKGLLDLANRGLYQKVIQLREGLIEISALFDRYGEIKKEDASLLGDKSPLRVLKNYIEEHISNIAKSLQTQKVSIKDIVILSKSLESTAEKSSEMEDTEYYKKIVPDVLGLDFKPGGYKNSLYESALNSLAIVDCIGNSQILKKLLFHDLEPSLYDDFRSSASKLNLSFESMCQTETKFSNEGDVNLVDWFESSNGNLQALYQKNEKALAHPNWLNTWVDYLRLKVKLYRNGLEQIIQGVEADEVTAHELKDLVLMVVFQNLSEEILKEDQYLSEFNGLEQTAIRDKFREYDKKILELKREKIAYQASRNKPLQGNSTGRVSTFTETSLIRHEANKKSRHIALRSLLKRSGASIQELKPCFMMSPMSVAQYCQPGQFEFDIVIMDEASQIRPEEALGSVARGNSLVVVGDPKQLPPTSFFDKLVQYDNDDEDIVALQESESILDSVIPVFRNRRLRWHYRSRHEELISFSNKHFYDSNLIIFPSPIQESSDLGVRYKYVEKGRYQNNRNVEEAQMLVDAVAKQVKRNPSETVGIVAMNAKQQAELETHLDQKLKDDPEFSAACELNLNSGENIFVKNLENVQGDERDVIFISMTYGPESIGGNVFQRFGPINSPVGWRRLNVLFTRSKKKMYVFSSMRASDILIDGSSNRGRVALRDYLEFCEKGHLHEIRITGKSPDSDFEISVMEMLSAHGYECEPQLGVAGFFIDLAVRDPGKPGRFLLAIECDGATYHSAKSARDRDRLRQDILEGLGWRVRRIWSTDWFKNPEAQLSPILQELDLFKTPIPVAQEVDETEVLETDQFILEVPEGQVDAPLEETEATQIDDLFEEIPLKDRLIRFRRDVIENQFGETNDENGLLRPAMLEAIINELPCSKAEFLECIPAYLRQGTSVEEAKLYLEDVLSLVAEYG